MPGRLVARVRDRPGLPVRLAERIRDRHRRRPVPDLERRDPPLQRGEQDERLERAPRLAPSLGGEIELAPAEAPPPDHRADRAGPRIDRDERRLRIVRGGQRGVDRALGGSLPVHVEGRANAQAPPVERVQPVARLQIAPDVLHEVRRPPSALDGSSVSRSGRACSRSARSRHRSTRPRPSESGRSCDSDAPPPGVRTDRGPTAPRSDRRAWPTGGASDPSRRDRSTCAPLPGRRRRRARSRPCSGTPRGSPRLDDVCSSFTARIASRTFRAIECSEPVRTFFTYCWVIVDPPWLMEPLRDVRQRRADHRRHVETVVTVEVGVLDRHHGLSERHRHLGERDQVPIDIGVQFRDLVPVAIEEHGRLRQGRDVGQLRRHVKGDERSRDGHERQEDREDRDQDDAPTSARCRAGAAATQASSCDGPEGPIDGARVAGTALMASGASSVEATTRRSAPANPSERLEPCTPSLSRVSGRHEHREDRPRGRVVAGHDRGTPADVRARTGTVVRSPSSSPSERWQRSSPSSDPSVASGGGAFPGTPNSCLRGADPSAGGPVRTRRHASPDAGYSAGRRLEPRILVGAPRPDASAASTRCTLCQS